jgi:hypothetical protein
VPDHRPARVRLSRGHPGSIADGFQERWLPERSAVDQTEPLPMVTPRAILPAGTLPMKAAIASSNRAGRGDHQSCEPGRTSSRVSCQPCRTSRRTYTPASPSLRAAISRGRKTSSRFSVAGLLRDGP